MITAIIEGQPVRKVVTISAGPRIPIRTLKPCNK
jgi:hypothetical protein